MVRFLTFLSYSTLSLAMVLATVAVLAVPEDAFADAGSDCAEYCGSFPPGAPEEYWQCLADCCSRDAACCASACGSSDPNNDCYAVCTAQTSCRSDLKETGDCANSGCQQPQGAPKTCITPGTGGCDGGGTCACSCAFRPLAKTPDCYCWK